ncbi:threonine/serine ThrE exporter family protein [Parendozoicomonas haliclonae]|uniref:Inner membrane protein YjjP n=1 Tax=Parendozoicomonas haliclonae TaxID=1960125 RepID=A0A1X7ALC1_9GAMM|nr:threonine/serine exporter family protein [Parendozoicomonas haliclonae]SMA48766.1 Inner membrane protein YjjP [Parendozoicomonas haliclonae]
MPVVQARDVARLLVDIGVLLLRSGAHTERTIRNLKRFAASFGYQTEIFVAFSGVTITVQNEEGEEYTTLFGRVENHGVHLATVAAISQLSWRVADEPCAISELRSEIRRIKALPHYPKWLIVLMIGISCGALARIAGADWPVVGLTALASSIALLVRMKLQQWRVNNLLVVLASAMVASMVGSTAHILELGSTSGLATAASVLFLIPGVPLINAVIDMINGHMTTGIGRGAMGLAISFSLAGGMLIGMQMMGAPAL